MSHAGTIMLREYRYPGEILSLVITFSVIALMIVATALLFPDRLQSIVNILVLTVAGVFVYILIVLIQQRTALGTLVRVGSRQFANVYGLACVSAERLSMRPVPVYVARSADMKIYPLGIWRKPLIVVTSAMIDQLDDESLSFFIAREQSHILAGHTWLRVLLKPLGSDVAIIGKLFNSVIFGDWVNRSELTADRAGLIACQSLTTAIRAMLKLGVGVNLFNQLDIEEFLGQITDVSSMGGRLTEVVAGQPYLTQRIRALTKFALSEAAQNRMCDHTHTQILDSLPGSFVRSAGNHTDADSIVWVLQSLSDKSRHPLDKPHVRIGRHEGNDIILQNDLISRFHAEIFRQGHDYYVVDKGSSNGVWLNGRRINESEKLAIGDRVSFGNSEYSLVSDTDS